MEQLNLARRRPDKLMMALIWPLHTIKRLGGRFCDKFLSGRRFF